jgi:5-formyltetrahydrofolate cyclo-ligase
VAVLVPGVVFDRHGGRIGFGKGYYDAFLGRAGRIAGFRTIRIGVAWDFQVRGAVLPADRHDVRMDMIVTEKRVIICGKAVRS